MPFMANPVACELVKCGGTTGARGAIVLPILDLRTRTLRADNWLLHNLSQQPPYHISVPPPLLTSLSYLNLPFPLLLLLCSLHLRRVSKFGQLGYKKLENEQVAVEKASCRWEM